MDFAVKKDVALKCSQCDGALSTFPIHTYEDGTFVCGRCRLNDGRIARRNMAYELLAQHLNFACHYSSKGCKARLTPGLRLSHESTCKYKPVKCLNPCEWQDTVDKLYKHCTSAHPGSIVQNTRKFNIATDKAHYFLYACNEVFLVGFIKTSKGIQMSVNPVNPSKTIDMYDYDIKFHSNWSESAKLFDSKRQNCLLATLYFDSVNVNQSHITCEVNMNEKSISNMFSKLHDNIMQRLKCTSCAKNVAPPIYTCCTYIYCEACIVNSPTCRTCKAQFTERRNQAIEEIADECTYSCKHDGCTHLLSAAERQDHESQCDFRVFKCPICTESGRIENLIWKHIRNEHTVYNIDVIQDGGGSIKFESSTKPTSFVGNNNQFVFNAWRLGPNPVGSHFWYTLKLNWPFAQIFIKRKCPAFIEARVKLKYLKDYDLISKINFEQIDA